MKPITVALISLAWTTTAWADDCQKSVDNLVRWAEPEFSSEVVQAQVEECQAAVLAGVDQAILAARCLSEDLLDEAVSCLSQAIQEPQRGLCSESEDPASCLAELAKAEGMVRAQLENMIRSGQPLGAPPPDATTELPPPPTDPGSCAQMIQYVRSWSSGPEEQVEESSAVSACELKLQTVPEYAVVVMCLSRPELDVAVDCLITEAIRANLSTCQAPDPNEQLMCEQMLFNMREDMREEFRNSILDGSLTHLR